LIAKQKANLKAASQGAALLARMKSDKKPGAAKRAVSGADKIARAKAKASGGGMDVDKPITAKKPVKPAKKTQADLDNEMRLYDRQRRFAGP
jgi:hypothetical protein